MDDLVSKKVLIKAIENIEARYGNDNSSLIEQGEVLDLITEAPTVDIETIRHGEWLEWWPGDCALIMTGEEMLYECNLCTAKFEDKSRYCPYCGAKMDGERKDQK